MGSEVLRSTIPLNCGSLYGLYTNKCFLSNNALPANPLFILLSI
jgi:hypothetical protein